MHGKDISSCISRMRWWLPGWRLKHKHFCLGSIVCSGNGLLPTQHQAITWTNVDPIESQTFTQLLRTGTHYQLLWWTQTQAVASSPASHVWGHRLSKPHAPSLSPPSVYHTPRGGQPIILWDWEIEIVTKIFSEACWPNCSGINMLTRSIDTIIVLTWRPSH